MLNGFTITYTPPRIKALNHTDALWHRGVFILGRLVYQTWQPCYCYRSVKWHLPCNDLHFKSLWKACRLALPVILLKGLYLFLNCEVQWFPTYCSGRRDEQNHCHKNSEYSFIFWIYSEKIYLYIVMLLELCGVLPEQRPLCTSSSMYPWNHRSDPNAVLYSLHELQGAVADVGKYWKNVCSAWKTD